MSSPPLPGSTTITGRYPGRIGQTFVAIPDELYQYRAALDLDSGSMALVHALERRRWRFANGGAVRVTFEMLTADTGDSEATLIRRVRKLEDAGHLNVTRAKGGQKRNQANVYDLRPLWKALAKAASKDAKKHRQNASPTTCKMTAKEEPLTWSPKEPSQKSFDASSPRALANPGDEVGKRNLSLVVAA